MIVVDTDVLSAFLIKTPQSDIAIKARKKDSRWIAPILWQSEFRSVLRQYIVAAYLKYEKALWIAEKAGEMMRENTYTIPNSDVLKLVHETKHSSYDCEYVALAQSQNISLVTRDKKLVSVFPETAILLEDFV